MFRDSILCGEKNRVIAPDDLLFPDLLRELPECADEFGFRRQIFFDCSVIRRQRELEIITVSHGVDLMEQRQHRSRIFCPEYDAFNLVRGEGDLFELLRVERIADGDRSGFQPFQHPFGVIRRNVRASACADDHR